MAKHRSLASDLAALWFQAPMVIAARTQAMAVAAMTGSATDYVEASRMVTEKMAAAAESVVACNVALAKEGMGAAAALALGKIGRGAGHKRIASAALRPYAKRVRANARRLSK
ncbi:hypothetical protein [Ensifer aridi]|uniref:hypothetical protein n=1 Tax=Ensifer aridi TaxID=1708715 RepID=UPI000A0FCF76|nr:hypothetical protein [Ensifer aridi]